MGVLNTLGRYGCPSHQGALLTNEDFAVADGIGLRVQLASTFALPLSVQNQLARLNDSGTSFLEIADLLERDLLPLL